MGVRRTGKTFLSRSLPDVDYLDCELPSIRQQLASPESFLRERQGRTVVLDEIHRLENPSEVLKIAADHFPGVRILATGSSTLGASARFRDTLAGRKEEVLLTPMTSADLADFGGPGIEHRLRNGGLPPMFLNDAFPERECQEWMDAYWAKDVQELFRLERRHSFQRFLELLFVQSGGLFEAASFASPCQVSRTTIQNYLAALEATFAVTVVRPYHSGKAAEIVAAPKVYGFDTGFVCVFRGWRDLGPDRFGPLWEHYVLNELRARLPSIRPQYWRDKQKHEVGFVIEPHPGAPPAVIECKWSADAFDPANLRIFRRRYPEGANLVVARNVTDPYTRQFGSLAVRFAGIEETRDSILNPQFPSHENRN